MSRTAKGGAIVYVEPCRDGDDDCDEPYSEEEVVDPGIDPAAIPIYTAFDENMKDTATGEREYSFKTVLGKTTVFSGSESHKFPTGTYFSSLGKHVKAFRHFVLNKDGPIALTFFRVFDRSGCELSESCDRERKKNAFKTVEEFRNRCRDASRGMGVLLRKLSDEDRVRFPKMETHDDLGSWDAFLYPPNDQPWSFSSARESRSGVFCVTKASRTNPEKLKCYLCIKCTSGPHMESTLARYTSKENKTFDAKRYVQMSHSCSETALRNACRVANLICGVCGFDAYFEKEVNEGPTKEPKMFTYPVRCIPSFVQYYNSARFAQSPSRLVATAGEGGGGGGGGEIFVATWNYVSDSRETGTYNGNKVFVHLESIGALVSVPVDSASDVVHMAFHSYADWEDFEANKETLGAIHASEEEMRQHEKITEAMRTVKSSGMYIKKGGERGGEVEEEEVFDRPLHVKTYAIMKV